MIGLFQKFKNNLQFTEDIALVMLRVLLAYVFYQTGIEKVHSIDGTIYWFEGLGIPFPAFNAYFSMLTEIFGVVLLFTGLGTRIISLPLIIVLLVALFTVHIDHGWLVIGSSLNDPEVASRVARAKAILKEYGNWDWLSAKGTFVVLQNGMENVVTYISMLLVLLARGPGKYSIDVLIEARYNAGLNG